MQRLQRPGRLGELRRKPRGNGEFEAEVPGRQQAVAQAGEVARPASAQPEARQGPGEVRGTLERGAQPVAQVAGRHQEGDGVLAFADQGRIGERPGETIRKEPRSAGRHRGVDGGEQAAGAFSRERAGQFQVGAGGGIDREHGSAGAPGRRIEDRAAVELGLLHVEEGGSRGRDLGTAERPEGVEGRDTEMILEPALRGGRVETLARQRRHGRAGLAPEGGQIRIVVDHVRHQDLTGLETGDLGRQPLAVGLAHHEMARGDVQCRQSVAPARLGGAPARHGQEQVGPAGFEEPLLGDRAGRDEPHHIASDDGFAPTFPGLRRILGLLADRDAVAEADQSLKVVVRALHRNAAHRDVPAQMFPPLGEHDPESPAGDLRILEEQLVEVAHPVEEQAVRVGRLDLDVLRHHRGDAAVRRGGFGRCGRSGALGHGLERHRSSVAKPGGAGIRLVGSEGGMWTSLEE